MFRNGLGNGLASNKWPEPVSTNICVAIQRHKTTMRY